MITRRAVLNGTAAASIAAIASARGIVSAAAQDSGFDCGFGDLEDGALGAFYKEDTAFRVFLKWDKAVAEVFYKESPAGGVEVFFKSFFKGWTPTTNFFLKELGTLQGASAAFAKVHAQGAEFFLKDAHGVTVFTSFETDSEGVQINVDESSPSSP
jgi:hypothetical protein